MTQRTQTIFLAAFLVTLLLALTATAGLAASSPAAPAGAPAAGVAADVEQPNWAEHVAPILFSNCVSCHRPGQVAPMSLLSYQEARPWAKSIRKVTAERVMPPWFANPAHGDFVEDPRLTEDQIATIAKWVDAGAPSGDLASAPQAPTFASEWRMGKPDVVLTMEPFQVTDEMEDHYEWLRLDNPLKEDRWIKAFEVRPTFMEGAHHNLTYIAPAGATLASVQGAGRLEMDYLGGWAPGVVPMRFREGYGKLLPANSTVFFQMHYHKTPGPGTGGIDQTSVGLELYEGAAEKKVTSLWVLDPALDIPAGEANYRSASEFTFEHDALLFNFTPHMHLRGKAMRYTVEYPDGRKEVLLDVNDYDFNWQLTYSPREPLQVPAGTKVAVDAVFDNSPGNVSNPDPSINVHWGEKTTDEMMIGFLDYTYVNQEEMPTHAVPEAMKARFEQMRKLRESQKSSAATSTSGRNE